MVSILIIKLYKFTFSFKTNCYHLHTSSDTSIYNCKICTGHLLHPCTCDYLSQQSHDTKQSFNVITINNMIHEHVRLVVDVQTT